MDPVELVGPLPGRPESADEGVKVRLLPCKLISCLRGRTAPRRPRSRVGRAFRRAAPRCHRCSLRRRLCIMVLPEQPEDDAQLPGSDVPGRDADRRALLTGRLVRVGAAVLLGLPPTGKDGRALPSLAPPGQAVGQRRRQDGTLDLIKRDRDLPKDPAEALAGRCRAPVLGLEADRSVTLTEECHPGPRRADLESERLVFARELHRRDLVKPQRAGSLPVERRDTGVELPLGSASVARSAPRDRRLHKDVGL
mmetsp:Transcript_21457/g.51187  ORF Transcript_21457/g.51187 Transcript_21457/m.51187 type:complete len:252 (-) Transcript_21457:41-796(-)